MSFITLHNYFLLVYLVHMRSTYASRGAERGSGRLRRTATRMRGNGGRISRGAWSHFGDVIILRLESVEKKPGAFCALCVSVLSSAATDYYYYS